MPGEKRSNLASRENAQSKKRSSYSGKSRAGWSGRKRSRTNHSLAKEILSFPGGPIHGQGKAKRKDLRSRERRKLREAGGGKL